MKKLFRKFGLLFYITFPLIAADQITKALVRSKIEVGGSVIPFSWLPILKFIHVNNTGVAFGMLQGAGWVFAILALIISIGIIYYFPRIDKKDGFIRFALALQLAGAIGNLIDRIVFGSVTDFVSWGNFAIFNVADASITIGTILLVIGFLIQEIREKKSKKESKQNNDSGKSDNNNSG